MQRALLAILYGLDYREPIQWPFGEEKEEERGTRFVDIILVRLP